MTYRPLAPVAIEPGGTIDEHTETIRRLAKMVNGLSKQVDLLTAQSDTKQIQGVEISTTAPEDNQVLTYDVGTETARWETP